MCFPTGSANGPSSDESDQELLNQVKDLKSCLLQRDNEIAILVNMVKKGKKGGASWGDVDHDEEERRLRQRQHEEEEESLMQQAAEERSIQPARREKQNRGEL